MKPSVGPSLLGLCRAVEKVEKFQRYAATCRGVCKPLVDSRITQPKRRYRPSQTDGRRGFFAICRRCGSACGRHPHLRSRRPRCGRLSGQRLLPAARRECRIFLSVGLQAFDSLLAAGCAGRGAAHGGADGHKGRSKALHSHLHLPRSSGRDGRRPTAARTAHAYPQRRRQHGADTNRREARRDVVREGRVRLPARTVLRARRHSRHILIRRVEALPHRPVRRRDRLYPTLRHIEPAVVRASRHGGDHTQHGRCRRGAHLAGGIRLGGYGMVYRCRSCAGQGQRNTQEAALAARRTVDHRPPPQLAQCASEGHGEDVHSLAERQSRRSRHSTRTSRCWPTT